MKCKNCGAKVDEAEGMCPQCGEMMKRDEAAPQAADDPIAPYTVIPPPAPKKSRLPIVLIALGLLAATVVGLVVGGVIPLGTGKENPEIVVQMGDKSATNDQLCFYYWEEANNLIYTYGGYGLFDTEMAFSQQDYPDESYSTWHDMLLEQAADTWASYTRIYEAAVAAGHQMSDAYVEYMDTLAQQVEEQAALNEMESADAYLKTYYSDLATLEGFIEYSNRSCMVSSYVNQVYDEFLAPYLETVELIDSINIRHILFKTGTEDDGAVKDEADRVYQLFLETPTEDAFSQLAVEYSEDGSYYLGGLYENVAPGQMVTEFNDWCFDPSRQPGDYGIVQTTYGYHLMYFSGFGEQVAADSSAEDAADAAYDAWIENLLSDMDYSVNPESAYPW